MPSRFPLASLLTSAGISSALAFAAGCSSTDIPIGDTGGASDAGQVLGSTSDGATPSDAGSSPDGSSAQATDVITGLPTVPLLMASDGTTLYLLDSQTLDVGSVPVTGASSVTSVYAKGAARTLLQADATGVYIIGYAGGAAALLHVTASGGAATAVSDGTGTVIAATVSGQNAYWVQVPSGQEEPNETGTVKTAPVGGGASITLGQFGEILGNTGLLAVSTTAVFYSGMPRPTAIVPLSGLPDGGSALFPTSGNQCDWLPSAPGSASVFCVSLSGGPVAALHADGTATTLATSYYSHDAVTDSTYLYWSDMPAPGGLIMKVPIAGGTPSVVVNEAATALAVDDTAIYWATSNGTIRRLLK